MKNEFVPYDRALRLKALGFDEPCFGFYDDIDKGFNQIHSMASVNGEQYSKLKITKAPTFSQAFRWFREKYGLVAEFNWHFPSKCYATSIYPNDFYLQAKSYEEAELACLDKLIEIVELKQNKDENN